MKRLVTILTLCTLLFCASCTETITDNLPPLSDIVEAAPPQQSIAPEAPEVTAPQIDSPVMQPPDIRLEISQSPPDSRQLITYTYINGTDKAVNIVAIPRLERAIPEGWETVEFSGNVGFCGTPDCLAAHSRSLEWTLDTEYLYGGALDAGLYLLSFEVVDDNYEIMDMISGVFSVL